MKIQKKSELSKNSSPSISESKNGSLARGLRICEVLLESPSPMSLLELANACDLDSSTTYRMAIVLLDLGYIRRDDAGKRYFAAPRLLSPLGIMHPINEFRREARHVLESVRDTTNETTSLVLYVGGERLIVDLALGAQSVVPYYETWLRSPLHGSATGKIMLAFSDPVRRETLLGVGPYEAVTPHTITDPMSLESEVETIRKNQYAVSRDEVFVGLAAIAAPILFRDQIVGCVAVVGKTSSITPDREAELGLAVKMSASLIAHTAPQVGAAYHMYRSITAQALTKLKTSSES